MLGDFQYFSWPIFFSNFSPCIYTDRNVLGSICICFDPDLVHELSTALLFHWLLFFSVLNLNVCVLLLSTEEKKLCCEACKECLMFLFILWNGWSILLVWSCFFCLFGTNFNKKIFLTISQVSVSCTNQSKAGICCHSLLLTTYTPTHTDICMNTHLWEHDSLQLSVTQKRGEP